MKKRIITGMLLWILLMLTACGNGEKPAVDESFLMPLQIGVLEYIPLPGGAPNENKHTSELVYLRPGEPVVTLLSCMYEDMATVNINLHFAYEGGSCTVTAPDEDIQIAMRDKAGCLYQMYAPEWDTWRYACEHTIDNTGWLGVNPLGSENGHFWFDTWEEQYESVRYENMPVGRECFLTVEAFDFAFGQTAVTAKLRVVQFPDTDERTETDKSGYFEIELVEYELSDHYKMMLE